MSNQLSIFTNKDVDGVLGLIKEKEKGGLRLPAKYSAANALNSAYLMLKEGVDKNGKPLLEACSRESITQAVINMAVNGLNPAKKQCYFVAFGSKCNLVPSYFGTLAMAKRFGGVIGTPVANVIYKDDLFEYGIDPETGERRITKHEQRLENINNSKIIGAYAIVKTPDQTVVEIMNIDQIRQSWSQGAAKGSSPAHNKFAEEMAKKTVLNRACKLLINSSDDSALIDDEASAFNEVTEDPYDNYVESTATEVREEIQEKANSKPLEIQEKDIEQYQNNEETETSITDDIQVEMDF
ncbi:MAG TPA: recombinase RecT [Bacteroidales bacterium]|nr:recombinase RecT [Bacteroidales bacterium]